MTRLYPFRTTFLIRAATFLVALGSVAASADEPLPACCAVDAATLSVAKAASTESETTLVDIDGIDALRTAFEADRGHPRMILLLSPTCPVCVQGAKWVQQEIFEKRPDADLKTYSVWLPMLPADARDRWRAELLPDARVRHYWNENKDVGRWFTDNVKTCGSLGDVAWDVFYLFDEEATWEDVPDAVKGCGAPVVRNTDALSDGVAALLDGKQAKIMKNEAEEDSGVVKISVMYFDGCPNYTDSLAAVNEIARKLGIPYETEVVNIKSEEQAHKRRFLGSPTVHVNGLDVEPAARTRETFGFACRIYAGAGAPSHAMMETALKAAYADLEAEEGRS